MMITIAIPAITARDIVPAKFEAAESDGDEVRATGNHKTEIS